MHVQEVRERIVIGNVAAWQRSNETPLTNSLAKCRLGDGVAKSLSQTGHHFLQICVNGWRQRPIAHEPMKFQEGAY